MTEKDYLTDARMVWDDAAPTFDLEADHGMRDPLVKAAWRAALAQFLPGKTCKVLDAGCGTGSMSILAAELGCDVVGIDCSPRMIELARLKAAASALPVVFHVMDAAQPSMGPGQFDVVMCRHLLWTLPNPADVLRRWKDLLADGGRLVLIEGFWSTGAGLKVDQIRQMLPAQFSTVAHISLAEKQNLWGKEVGDERYAVVASL